MAEKQKRISDIFGELPIMLKQQVLEFAGGGNGIYMLSYSKKTKTIINKINPAFMRKTLEYKLNNPPKYSNNDVQMQIMEISPPNLARFEVWLSYEGDVLCWFPV